MLKTVIAWTRWWVVLIVWSCMKRDRIKRTTSSKMWRKKGSRLEHWIHWRFLAFALSLAFAHSNEPPNTMHSMLRMLLEYCHFIIYADLSPLNEREWDEKRRSHTNTSTDTHTQWERKKNVPLWKRKKQPFTETCGWLVWLIASAHFCAKERDNAIKYVMNVYVCVTLSSIV